MALKDLLVVLESGPEGDVATEYALSLAAATGAHLTATYATLQMIAPVSFMGDYPYEIIAKAMESAQADGEAAFEKLRSAAPANVQLDYVPFTGFAGEAINQLSQLARHFDMTIMRQASPDEGGHAASLATGIILGSGRPAMVVPYIHRGPAKTGKAMVAWDRSMAASRALAGAMPLLQKAGKVEVVTVASRGGDGVELPGFNITRHLARHGVNAELRQLPPGNDIAAILLSHAADTQPDYIVMGCYGHSRLREMVLGGTSREILKSMTVPLLMAH